jgi:hypothetical protein
MSERTLRITRKRWENKKKFQELIGMKFDKKTISGTMAGSGRG